MAAIVSANSLGISTSSLALLGTSGTAGQTSLGAGGERIYLNTATGNLVVQDLDEVLVGLGPDLGILRTYNSQGQLDGDNNDGWRIGVYRQVALTSGAANQAGSTVRRIDADGATQLYTFDGSKYVSTDGGGAFDTLAFDGTSLWTFTNGDTRVQETYQGDANGGRLVALTDPDGNRVTFTYTGALVTQVQDASGETTYLDYAGNNLVDLRTVTSGGKTSVRTRYGYDAGNRLTSVTVDLTPDDASIADGKIFVTSYTYDGASDRIASILTGDGDSVRFSYDAQGRIASYAEGGNPAVLIGYTTSPQTATVSLPANAAALSNTDTQTTTTTYDLNGSALTAPAVGWTPGAIVSTTDPAAPAATNPSVAFDQNGNGVAVYTQGGHVLASVYDKASGAWSAPKILDNLPGALATAAPQLSVSETGNALVTWAQSDGTAQSVYARRYVNGAWQANAAGQDSGDLIDNQSTTAALPVGGINNAGDAVVIWLQPAAGTTTPNNLYASRFTGGAWQAPELLESNPNNILGASESVAIDQDGNATALWAQKAPGDTFNSIYSKRYVAGTGWQAETSTALETSSGLAGSPSVAFDRNGDGVAIFTLNGDLYASQYTKATDSWSAAKLLENLAFAVNTTRLTLSAGGNALVTWTQGFTNASGATEQNVYARRLVNGVWQLNGAGQDAGELVDTLSTNATVPIASINDNGDAIVAWGQPSAPGAANTLYASVFSGGAWQPQVALGGSGASFPAGVAIDRAGDASVIWSQPSNGNPNASILSERYGPSGLPYYVVPAGATWASIALALYGSSDVASELQSAMGNPPLTAGSTLVSFPLSLAHTVTATVTVPPYYAVQAGDTWQSIAQAVYGTSDAGAAGALQAAVGFPDLTAGLHLDMPATLTYTGTLTVTTQTDVTDALGNVTSYKMDAQGRLTEIDAPSVNGGRSVTSYAYTSTNELASATDATGATVFFSYDAQGNLLERRDALGGVVRYTYGSANQRLTETVYLTPDPDGVGPAQPAQPVTTRYAYDGENHLRFVVTPEGRVTEYRYNASGSRIATLQYAGGVYDVSALAPTDSLSEATLATWAAQQDLTRLLRSDNSYDFRGQLASITTYTKTDASGNGVADGTQATTLFVYDPRGQLLQTVAAKGSQTADPGDYVAAYTYDGLGRQLSRTQWVSATESDTTLTSYDDAGRRVVTQAANGLVQTALYSAAGDLLSISQSDAGGHALGTTSYFYDADHRLLATRDPLGAGTFYLYDAAGRQVAMIDPTGAVIETVYDAAGRAVQTIGYATRLTAAQLASLVDANGNPTNAALSSVRPATSANDRTTEQVYDAAGRLVFAIAEDGAVTEQDYDAAGQTVQTIQYAAPITTAALGANPSVAAIRALIVAGAGDRVQRFFYDGDGNLRGTLDAEGYLTERLYNAAGELVQTVAYATATDAMNRASGTLDQLRPAADGVNDEVTRYFYDARGETIGTLDAEGFLTEVRYDANGNHAQTIQYATSTDPAMRASGTFDQLRPATSAGDRI
jgi:YD repeat-containing protein